MNKREILMYWKTGTLKIEQYLHSIFKRDTITFKRGWEK